MIEIYEGLLKDKKMAQTEESTFKSVFDLAIEQLIMEKWDNPYLKKCINKVRSLYTDLKTDPT